MVFLRVTVLTGFTVVSAAEENGLNLALLETGKKVSPRRGPYEL